MKLKATIRIRKASVEDLTQVARLSRELRNEHKIIDSYSVVNSAKATTQKRFLRKCLKSRTVALLVAERKERLVGYLWAEFTRPAKNVTFPRIVACVRELYVGTRYRNQRIATALWFSLLKWLRTNKVRHVELSVYTKNTLAMNLWRKFGFTEYLKTFKLNLRHPTHEAPFLIPAAIKIVLQKSTKLSKN